MTLPLLLHEKFRSVPRDDGDKRWLREKRSPPDVRNEEEKRGEVKKEERKRERERGRIFTCVLVEKLKWILTSLAVCADSMSAYCISAWKVSETKREIFC